MVQILIIIVILRFQLCFLGFDNAKLQKMFKKSEPFPIFEILLIVLSHFWQIVRHNIDTYKRDKL